MYMATNLQHIVLCNFGLYVPTAYKGANDVYAFTMVRGIGEQKEWCQVDFAASHSTRSQHLLETRFSISQPPRGTTRRDFSQSLANCEQAMLFLLQQENYQTLEHAPSLLSLWLHIRQTQRMGSIY
jgi:hypothetical protein